LRHRRWAGAMKTNRELAEVREWRSVSSNSNSDDSTSKLFYVDITCPFLSVPSSFHQSRTISNISYLPYDTVKYGKKYELKIRICIFENEELLASSKDLGTGEMTKQRRKSFFSAHDLAFLQASFFVQIPTSLLDSLYNFIKRGNPSLETRINPVTIVNNTNNSPTQSGSQQNSLTLLSVNTLRCGSANRRHCLLRLLTAAGLPRNEARYSSLSALSLAPELTKQWWVMNRINLISYPLIMVASYKAV
jgi:hypothetical protein